MVDFLVWRLYTILIRLITALMFGILAVWSDRVLNCAGIPMLSTHFTRTPIRLATGVTLALVLIPFLASRDWRQLLHICITENRGAFRNISGADFEISETSCSTLGEDSSVSVFASRPAQNRKALLFKYGPAGQNPFPVIRSIDQHTVQISVPRLSDVIFQSERWDDLSVIYDIGNIDYPARAQKN